MRSKSSTCKDSGLTLNLVYNPQAPVLPPEQILLEHDYRQCLAEQHGIAFNSLYTLVNMPIGRFGATLTSKGELRTYLQILRDAHQDENIESVMCRSLLSVDWQGFVYDCDFNQMLGLPFLLPGQPRKRISELLGQDIKGNPIAVRDHCFGCTAGQGSSCGGALRSGSPGRGILTPKLSVTHTPAADIACTRE